MNIISVKHRGLRRFIENDDPRELRPDLVNRTRNILAALITAVNMDGVKGHQDGAFINSLAIEQELGACPFLATGALRSTLKAIKYLILI